MSWLLFLDDERDPATSIDDNRYRRRVGLPDLLPLLVNRQWVIARSVEEALDHIHARGLPIFIAFDHDLGIGAPSGHDLARRIVDMDLDGTAQLPTGFGYEVHSANPVGAANIRGLLDGYLRWRKDSPAITLKP